MGQAQKRKQAGLPPRAQQRAQKSAPVPNGQDSYEEVLCTIVDGELKTARISEGIYAKEYKKLCEGATYKNIFRVYESGRISPCYSLNPKDAPNAEACAQAHQFENDTRKFQKHLTEHFDEMYPETAKKAREFVDIFTDKVTKMKDDLGELEDDGGWFSEKTLTPLLEDIEGDYLRTGQAKNFIGWGLRTDVVALFEIGLAEWKYRHARAVSEVAKNVGAKYLLTVSEAWERDLETGKRTGRDALCAQIISPDGIVLSCASGTYLRKGDKIEVVEPIKGEKADHTTEQRLFPAWSAVN